MGATLGGLAGLLGAGSTVQQLFVWNVMGQVLLALLQPYLTQAQYDTMSANPLVEISPADAAEMVVKTILTESEGAAAALKYGIDAARFHNMYLNQGEPPALEQVLEWWRRGLIPWSGGGAGTVGVLEALQTSRIRPEWYEAIPKVQYMPITAADAVNAWVRNQIDEATALQLLDYNALQPDMATILYNTTGRPPSPMELAHLVRIGTIPLRGTGATALSLQQGIYEGDLKDKWEPAFEALINVYPGLFEVLQMAKDGGLPADAAAKLYAITGLPAEYIPYMVAAGAGTAVAKAKQITEAQTLKLYADKIIDEETATKLLNALGYSGTEVTYLLDLENLQTELKALNSAVTRVGSTFIARKITAEQAQSVLNSLGVSSAAAQQMLTTWTAERAVVVKVLTEGQIVDAFHYGVIDQPTAQDYLEGLGYSPFDAWLLISVKEESAQPNMPAQGANVTGAAQ